MAGAIKNNFKIGRCGGMADATDSKSVEGNFMWVRLPPSAPYQQTKCLTNQMFDDY